MPVRITAPVTIVTGFLGAGKTTLVNRLLRELHGQRIAVVENEFGEVGVDAEFLAQTGEETIIQLANGCLCCTVRGDFARALQQLVEQSDAGRFVFDRVLIETSGLADPGPVIQTFLAETAMQARFHLDGVVAVVDGVNALRHLEQIENRAQVAYADRLLLGKCDLAETGTLAAAVDALVAINPRAPIVECDLHAVAIDVLLGHLFDARGFELDFVPADEVRRAREGRVLAGPALRAGSAGVAPAHTPDVNSCVFLSERPLELERLNAFLDAATTRFGDRLWRCKGVLYVARQRPRLVLQGVQRLIQIGGGALWRPYEKRQTTLVFIGQGLDTEWLFAGLRACEVAVAA